MRCPSGHDNPDNAGFCMDCGEPLHAGGKHEPPETSQPLRTIRRGRFVIGAALAAVALVGAGVAGGMLLADGNGDDADQASDRKESPSDQGTETTTFDVDGTIALSGYAYDPGDACSGDGGYSDIVAGAQVTVYDSKSQPVALGALEPGISGDYDCIFEFHIPEVPDSGTIYSVEVGHRGAVQFTKEQASTVALTLGD